jgi:hypothetical protein
MMKRPRGFLQAVILCAVLAALSACGYSLVGRGSFLPESIKTIAIPPFKNNTTQYRLGEALTTTLTEEFITRGQYEILPAAGPDADAVLLGEVLSYSSKPLTLDADGRVTQFIVLLNAKIRLQDLNTGEDLYYNDLFMFREEYQISVDSADFFDQEGTAIVMSAKDFSRTLVTSILEGF